MHIYSFGYWMGRQGGWLAENGVVQPVDWEGRVEGRKGEDVSEVRRVRGRGKTSEDEEQAIYQESIDRVPVPSTTPSVTLATSQSVHWPAGSKHPTDELPSPMQHSCAPFVLGCVGLGWGHGHSQDC